MKFFCKIGPVFFLLICNYSFSQKTNISELELQLQKEKGVEKISLLNKLSWEYRRSNPTKAFDYAETAVELSKKMGVTSGLAYGYKNLGFANWIKADYSKSELYYSKSKKLFEKIGNETETGNLSNLFGLLYWNKGEYQEAIFSYEEAILLFGEIGDREGKAKAQGNLGIIYYEIGNYEKSLEEYLKTTIYYQDVNDSYGLSNMYNNIGLIYSQQGNYKTAMRYYKLSLSIDLKVGDKHGQASSYTNIGVCYYYLGDLDSALYHHNLSLEASLKMEDKKGISYALLNIGDIEFERKNFASAEENFIAALEYKKETGEVLGEAIAWINLGRLRLEQHQYQEALKCFTNGLQHAENIGSIKYIADSYFWQSKAYEGLKNYEASLISYQSYSTYNDSLVSQETNSQLFNLQVDFETRKKEQEIKVWKKQSELESIQKRMITAISILLVIVAFLIISRQRLNRIKEKKLAASEQEKATLKQLALEKELEYNQTMLMSYTQKLIEKNRDFEKLREQMEQTDTNESPVDTERIVKINKLITSRIITDDDWEEFKRLYIKVYPSFFVRMMEHFPGITQAELRLAALIKLKLTGKEIASMIGISIDSVKKARQRLRKKMEIETDANLEEYVQDLS